jgi:hypothetical protein
MKVRSLVLTLVIALLCLFLASGAALASVEVIGKLPKAHSPAIVTTCGQSPGALMIKMLGNMVKLPIEEQGLLTADQAKKYKTVFITMGTSLKGMGAAGIDIDAEVKRVNAIIAQAKKSGALIIGTQLEGPSRRTDETDERSNQTVTSHADLLIIRRDVNHDGFFTKKAKEKGIPIVLVDQAMEAKDVLKTLFSL